VTTGKVSNHHDLVVYVPYPTIRQKFFLTNRCSWASPQITIYVCTTNCASR